MTLLKQLGRIATASVLATGIGTAASATMISITVTNNQSAGGLAITPLYTAVHDGTFDAFDVGSAASPGLELIAETGNQSLIASERLMVDPDSVGRVFEAGFPPPIQPGESVTGTLDVTTPGASYLTFLSMILPSNDTFIGNDNPTAYQLFDSNGVFLGDQIIEVTGAQIYDAGTEINGLEGVAFVQGQDIALGDAEGGTVQPGTSLAEFSGLTLATGDILGDPSQIDFFTNPSAFSLLTIEITEVAPVPLPASGLLLLGALGALRLRAKKKA